MKSIKSTILSFSVVALLSLGMLFAGSSEVSAGKPTATPTPTATATPTPVSTPTPVPTQTPVPTPTPSSVGTNPYGAGLMGHATPVPHPVTGRTINVVTEFGANPADNGTDDRPAIENAMNAAAAGDELYFPNGVYNLNSSSSTDSIANIVLKSGVNVRGESQTGVILRTNFDTGTGSTAYSVLKAKPKNNILISNMTITSTWNRSFSLDTVNTSPDIGGPMYPIHIEGSGTTPSYNITVDSVTIEKYNRIGVRIASSHDVVVKNSTVRMATDVAGSGAGYGVCIQGYAAGVDNTGLSNDSLYNVVDNCNFVGPYIRHGVLYQYYTHNNLVTNSTFTNTAMDSIDYHGEDEYKNEACFNTVTDCTNGAAVGLGNSGSTHDASGAFNYIHDNYISNCRRGIQIIYGSPDSIIENNTIVGSTVASGYGIQLLNGPRTILKGNYIHDNNSTGFVGIYLGHDAGTNGVGAGDPVDIQIINNRVNYNTNGIKITAGTATESGNETIGNTVLNYYHY